MAIELDNSFTVPVPPEQAWDVLLDVERIAPCMPGASVTSVEGDEIEGQVKVKLGPLSLTYKGTAKFTDKDQAGHTISIEATGKETRGSGTASATVQANRRRATARARRGLHPHLAERDRQAGPVRPLAAARGQRQAHPAVRHQPRGDDQRRQRRRRPPAADPPRRPRRASRRATDGAGPGPAARRGRSDGDRRRGRQARRPGQQEES